MSAIASSSDLSKQPDFDSGGASTKKAKKGSARKSSQTKASKTPNAALPKDFSLYYGYNEIAKDPVLTAYIKYARSEGVEVLRSRSPMLQKLPFKSALLFSRDDLPTALGNEFEAEFKPVRRGYDKLEVRFLFDTGTTTEPVITPT